jgi:hypothetical protein
LLCGLIQGENNIKDCFSLSYFFIPDPDIVNLDLIIEMQMDRQPNAHGVHVGRPIPGILVAGLASVGIIERHVLDTLLLSIVRLGGVDSHTEDIFSNFGMLLHCEFVLQECVFSGAQVLIVEVDVRVGVNAFKNQLYLREGLLFI